ncbi:hypothetical protein AFV8_gp51 [Betalipothrixvirus puteoliense]|uniref:Uncharacterized protein n=1 Tax=Betalipothrixvirus puteoliense TaxID=346884 RepID=A7WKY0_9VIRU|nr:hypothetical protein AFV8_gp51 [Acidianus filamentous virus 8]CAJ31728.1 conserved hypothetical protein [Acidianus filamentous virus 8]
MSLYVRNIIGNSCQSVIINFNVSGNLTVNTKVIKPPLILTPWNVSIKYDDVLWASYNTNTTNSDDVYNFSTVTERKLNYIEIYFCNANGHQLTSDEIQVQITVTDNTTGNTIYDDNIVIEINVDPIEPIPIFIPISVNTPTKEETVPVPAGTTIPFQQEINIVYTPVTLYFSLSTPNTFLFKLYFTMCGQTYEVENPSIVYPGGCIAEENEYVCTKCNPNGFCYNIVYPFTKTPIYNKNGQIVGYQTTISNTFYILFKITITSPCSGTINWTLVPELVTGSGGTAVMNVTFSE